MNKKLPLIIGDILLGFVALDFLWVAWFLVRHETFPYIPFFVGVIVILIVKFGKPISRVVRWRR